MPLLLVGRRSSEFVPNGIKVVCSSRHTPRLQKLQKLSLYDNMLSSIKVGSAVPHTICQLLLVCVKSTDCSIHMVVSLLW